MQLHLIESDKIYKEILETPIEKRDEVFKQKLLVPFINKFKIQNISFDENDVKSSF